MQWQASGAGSNLSCCVQDVPPCQFLYSTYGWHSIHQVCQMSMKSYRHKKAQRNNCGAIPRCGAWHLCRLCMRRNSQSVIVWLAAQRGLLRALPNSCVCRCLWSCRCWRDPHLLPGIRF